MPLVSPTPFSTEMKALGMLLQTGSVYSSQAATNQGDKLREAGGAGGDSIKLLGFSLPWEKPVGSSPTFISSGNLR